MRPYKAHLYAFSVRQPIPLLPIPLQPNESELLVDPGAILWSIYEPVRYDLVIDYNKAAGPGLDKVDAHWAREQVERVR